MAEFGDLLRLADRTSALPPVASIFSLARIEDEDVGQAQIGDSGELQPISAYVCIIEYEGNQRLITCRRYDMIGDTGYVGAICHCAGGYRQFRCDRIQSVFDPATGEALGDGSYFNRFEPESRRERSPSWGLTSSRKATLVAGMNVLAFMARCDGYWHPLESEPLEKFICSMWLRKEWPGDPPIDEIMTHAQRLSPDAETFFRGLRHYAQSSTSTQLLRRAVGDLIAADGIVCSAEANWGAEIETFFREYDEDEFRRLFLGAENSGIAFTIRIE